MLYLYAVFVYYCVFSLFSWLFSFVDFPSVLWCCWLGLLTCKNRLHYNLYCVGGDVKHCSIQSNRSLKTQLKNCHFQTWLPVMMGVFPLSHISFPLWSPWQCGPSWCFINTPTYITAAVWVRPLLWCGYSYYCMKSSFNSMNYLQFHVFAILADLCGQNRWQKTWGF